MTFFKKSSEHSLYDSTFENFFILLIPIIISVNLYSIEVKINMILLQVNQLCKYYGADIILSNIKLEVQTRDRIALVGRNGAGKSTLIKNYIWKPLL